MHPLCRAPVARQRAPPARAVVRQNEPRPAAPPGGSRGLLAALSAVCFRLMDQNAPLPAALATGAGSGAPQAGADPLGVVQCVQTL